MAANKAKTKRRGRPRTPRGDGGVALDRWLDRQGITIGEFAEEIGVHPAQISHYITAHSRPLPPMAEEIRKRTGIPSVIWWKTG